MDDAFTVDDLIACYERGVFPMADARQDESIFLIDPERRGVLPLDGVHVPRRLARTVRAEPFEIRIDTAFDEVVEACATARPGRLETWINNPIQRLYGQLFARGLAHSVAFGACFFGESMFSIRRDASKVALVHLVGRLIAGDYRLLDTQFITEHLEQFGTVEISRADYRRRLGRAWTAQADFYRLAAGATGIEVLQAISQAS
jgi:leucyl/phenylalanyl-tRNA--protein transferase